MILIIHHDSKRAKRHSLAPSPLNRPTCNLHAYKHTSAFPCLSTTSPLATSSHSLTHSSTHRSTTSSRLTLLPSQDAHPLPPLIILQQKHATAELRYHHDAISLSHLEHTKFLQCLPLTYMAAEGPTIWRLSHWGISAMSSGISVSCAVQSRAMDGL